MIRFKLEFFFVFIGILATIVANVATAQIMQPLIDKLFVAKQKEMLITIPLLMLGIYFLKAFGRYIQSVFTQYIGQYIITEFRILLLRKILYLDMEYISSLRNGEIISRITNDIGRIQYFVSLMLPELIREFFTVVALLGYVIYLNPLLSLYSLVVLPLVIFPIAYLSRKLRKISFGAQEKNSDLLAKLHEIFKNIEFIKVSDNEKFELQNFSKENWNFFKVSMKAIYFNQLASPILEVIGALSLAVVIYLGAKDVYAQKMSVGEFMAFLTAVGLVFQPARGLGIIYTKMQDALAASQRVFDILDKVPQIQNGTKTLQKIDTIEFCDVSLHYGEKQALEQISFYLKRPTKVALVGESGGGKSSIANLLLRLYEPSDGKVLINNKEIQTYTLESLRQNIAVVSQQIYIFADTIANNVAYAKKYDEAKVIEALKKANAYDFVMQFENGIHTMLEEFGTNLSGGQKQRIALARAIYKDASVLVLDEATAALDNQSEALILQALQEFAQDKIIIAIAHRLSTIQNFDTIIVLDKGKIVQIGDHLSLYKQEGLYKRLYEKTIKD